MFAGPAGAIEDADSNPVKRGAVHAPAKSAARLASAGKKGKEGQPPLDPADGLLADLRGGETQGVEAAQKLAELGTPRATEIMLDELALGVPPKVAAALLKALSQKGLPQSFEVLSLYAADRNPELRKLAISALADVRETRVVPLLVAALSDATPDVRAAAAQALSARREKAAEPALLKLLAHKDAAAAPALAEIGGPETARTLAEMVGNVPDHLLVTALGDLLKRKDFGPDPIRLEVVKTLGKIPGNDAVDALADYLKVTAKDKTTPSRGEASKIIEQRTTK
jgi:HEAT repeat protein